MGLMRSLAFWFGLLVLAFIGWVWMDSTRMTIEATWDGREMFRFDNRPSQMQVYIGQGAGTGGSFFRTPRDPEEEGGGDLPRKAYFDATGSEGDRSWMIGVPHAVVLGVAAVVWIGLLLIRFLWKRRRLTIQAAGEI